MNKNRLGLLFFLIALFAVISVAQKKEYTNPILAGFFPDPSICRVGNDYYLVNSTFSYYPGIPVFQSKDLVNWKQIGNVMSSPDVMKLEGLNISEGMFAPAIRFHEGWFYVTCTFVGGGGNFIVKSKKAAGPYSDPVWIPEINGIDPSLFFDEDGKTYIVYNSIAPDNNELYRGHRTIRIREFNIEEMKVKGEEHILINGGTDLSKKPIWIEGPHIYKKNGYYYLLASEGGTREDHSVVIFRSKEIFGIYESYKNNPILTHRNLDPKRPNPITCTGHADFVQTQSGDWYSVFLGSRPYHPPEKNHFNTGRETYLVPVDWSGEWPVMNNGKYEVEYHYPLPLKSKPLKGTIPQSGNFTLRDDFNKKKLDLNWIFLRTPKSKWYSLEMKKGFLTLNLRPENFSEKVNPSFIGRRQQHNFCSVTAKMKFNPISDNEKAGLLVFQNEKHYYYLCKSISDDKTVIQLLKPSDDNTNPLSIIASNEIKESNLTKDVFLKIETVGNFYNFYYSFDSADWILLKENMDAAFLSTETAGGFVGCIFALYASSLGKESGNFANYDWFEYAGKDKIYLRK